MARFVKLMKVKIYSDPSKDKPVYVNPEHIQEIESEDTMKIVELTLNGTILRVRGELDEIVEQLSPVSKRNINY